MKYRGISVLVIGWIAVLVGCSGTKSGERTEAFTKIDSLTETYLSLQDSMLQSWNVMVKDENEKIHAMHELIHLLLPSRYHDKDELVSLEQRLEQLDRIRFTQKSMSDPHVVEEYDFASNSLISELLSLTESNPQFSQNTELQTLVDRIRTADQRVDIYRSAYDEATTTFNNFLEENKSYLKEIDQNGTEQKRPLFQMASEN